MLKIYWTHEKTFFIEALEFRTSRKDELSNDVITATEKATCSALVKLALKLPEASLRPLLYKIFRFVEWSKSHISYF